MPLVIPEAVDVTDVADAVGAMFFERGVEYARQGRVLRIRWDDVHEALYGTVAGRREIYQTSAFFSRDNQALTFDHGECTCPIGFNCKHVAAVTMAAVTDRPRTTPKQPPRPPTWEESLGSLLTSGPTDSASRTGAVPLAIEVALAEGRDGSSVRLAARLVRPGRNGWVAGGLAWGKLGSAQRLDEYIPAHARLLREIYALYRPHHHTYPYYGAPPDDKSIDLTVFESPLLWPMLDEADAIGLMLVHSRKRLGPLEKYGSAELCLDVTRDERSDALTITPLLRVAGTRLDAGAIGFIGSTGHGVVYLDRAEVRASPDHTNWRLHLAKLVKPLPSTLRRMAVDNRRLEIPATEDHRFRDDYYPRLRHTATVISSDESFAPPAISAPTLVFHVAYGDEHELRTSWDWAYQVGEERRCAPLGTGESEGGYRDFDAEHEILATLDVPFDQIDLTRADPTRSPNARFRGIDTMRLTTELLPLLADRPGIDVEVTGAAADYREASDSLTIAVSTDAVADDRDWFDLGVTVTVEGHDVPFTDLFVALAAGQSHLLLADGAYFSLDKPELRSLRTLIEEARALHDWAGESLRISRFQAGLWDELTELGIVHHQAATWQRQVQGLLAIDSLSPIPVPDTLDATLRPYQVDGFRWLAFLWECQLGGILADDMGLGKTLQTLALICHAQPADAPFLIVAPTSVVSNWAAESARFAPGLRVVALSDTVRRRGQALAETIADADVVVTSYTLFRLDFDAYAEIPWSGLVLDEAQQVKNHQSKIYQCARRLPASFKLAITGTPMENNLMELWSLLSITAPGLFPSPSRFQGYYAQPIEKQGNTELLGRLRRRMKPLVKRRTKEQVAADLPEKQEQVLHVELHPRHRKLYQTHLQRERQKVLGLIDDMNSNRFTILRSLTLLRQLSLHAGLVDEANGDLPSSKIDTLVEQIHDVTDGGHRALVFSQFTGFLGLVRARLDLEGVPYCYLDGTTRNRPAVLKRFKEGSAPVFLISLKAGGFGLNLTEADYVFLLDPWWNPATEAQAVDRTHRIGQTRNVMVYRLIAKDTIEERVMALKERKAELFTNVMDDGNVFGGSLDADDIRALFA